MRSIVPSLAAIAVSFTAAAPAIAGAAPVVPGPLVGAGIPALLGLAYVYRRIRKSRG